MTSNRRLRLSAALRRWPGFLAGPWLCLACGAACAAEHGPAAPLGAELAGWTVAPFLAMLLAIAVLPLAAPHWWEHNKNKALVAAVLALPLATYLVAGFGEQGAHELEHKLKEYISFITLLGALFVISGCIYVQGSFSGTPLVNTGMLALGGLIASFIGTTGASVLLIRPVLRANTPRTRKAHVVVFFIFIVSNCGGLLTPLGDPPLFLGFLSGVPFTWTLQLWKEWACVNGALLVIFNVWDQIMLDRDEKEQPGSQLERVMQHEPLRVLGWHNFLFLGGIVAVIYAAGQAVDEQGHATWAFGVQEGLMALCALAAWVTTKRDIRQRNYFTFGPIIEVAVLFAGIFVTMTPALLILNASGPQLQAWGLREPWTFFWASGLLSSFLDNAPTYLTFTATAAGMSGIPTQGRYLNVFLTSGDPASHAALLAAISCGAVFMGANTYIGNGPNFMVKAIAEENGVKMPGFFGYMLYSGGILIPLFVLATLLFFR